MADTLSRKHRIRQHQARAAETLVCSSGPSSITSSWSAAGHKRTNRSYHQSRGFESKVTRDSGSCFVEIDQRLDSICGRESDQDDQIDEVEDGGQQEQETFTEGHEHFVVHRVSSSPEVAKYQNRKESSAGSRRHSSSRRHHQQQQQQQQQHDDSSGFVSSVDRSTSGSSMGRPNGPISHLSNQQQHLQDYKLKHKQRNQGKLIDDLERLMELTSGGGGGDSYATHLAGGQANSRPLSRMERGTTVSPIDYSTLCRDEFSSFIALTGSEHSKQTTNESDHHQMQLQIHSIAGGGEDDTGSSIGEDERILDHNSLSSAGSTSPLDRRTTATNTIMTEPAGPVLVGVTPVGEQPNNRLALPHRKQQPRCYIRLNQVHPHVQQESSLSPSNNSGSSNSTDCRASTGSRSADDRESDASDGEDGRERARIRRALALMAASSAASRGSSETASQTPSPVSSPPASAHSSSRPPSSALNSRESPSNQSAGTQESTGSSSPPLGWLVRAPSPRLGPKLERHLARLDVLLRLLGGRGHSSEHPNIQVTMEEAFDDEILEAESEIQVSPELRTSIEYQPLDTQRPGGRVQVSQELELELEMDDKLGGNLFKSFSTARKIIDNNFRSMLWTRNTDAQLDWLRFGSSELDLDFSVSFEPEVDLSQSKVVAPNRAQLEASLLERLMVGCEECWPADQEAGERLIRSIRFHVRAFLDNYKRAVVERRKCQTNYGWRTNWSFAFGPSSDNSEDNCDVNDKQQRDNELHPLRAVKRAKLSSQELHMDLISYDTLMEAGRQGVIDLTGPSGRSLIAIEPERKLVSTMTDAFEAEQKCQIEELEDALASSPRRLDLGRMLINDEEETNHSNEGLMKDRKSTDNELTVSYAPVGGSHLLKSGRRVGFEAFGHWIQLPVQYKSDQVPKISVRKQLLSNLAKEVYTTNLNQQTLTRRASQPVGFSVELSDVRLHQPLPVIQFCTKIRGSLPIRVRWFWRGRGENEREISFRKTRPEIMRNSNNNNHNKKSEPIEESDVLWKSEMNANCLLEEKVDSTSHPNSPRHFRMWRHQDQLILELSGGAQFGLGHFRCVLQNHCSSAERSFELSLDEGGWNYHPIFRLYRRLKLNTTGEQEVDLAENRKPIQLRTWSERTLHKPQPSTTKNDAMHLVASSENSALPVEASSVENEKAQMASSKLQLDRSCMKIGDKSSSFEDKFGEQFPYHPANLRRRIEANRCAPSLAATLARSSRLASSPGSDNICSGRNVSDLTESNDGDNNNNRCPPTNRRPLSARQMAGGAAKEPTNSPVHPTKWPCREKQPTSSASSSSPSPVPPKPARQRAGKSDQQQQQLRANPPPQASRPEARDESFEAVQLQVGCCDEPTEARDDNVVAKRPPPVGGVSTAATTTTSTTVGHLDAQVSHKPLSIANRLALKQNSSNPSRQPPPSNSNFCNNNNNNTDCDNQKSAARQLKELQDSQSVSPRVEPFDQPIKPMPRQRLRGGPVSPSVGPSETPPPVKPARLTAPLPVAYARPEPLPKPASVKLLISRFSNRLA